MESNILKEFLAPLERLSKEQRLLERVKNLESYFRRFCKKYEDEESGQLIKEYSQFFEGIDSKSFSEKLGIIKNILSFVPQGSIHPREIENMRLFLERPLSVYKGVGDKTFTLLAEKGLKQVRDVLFYLPYSYIDKRKVGKIFYTKAGEKFFLKVKIVSIKPWHQKGFLSKKGDGLVATVTDGTGFLTLKWFYPPPKFIKDQLKVNNEVYVFGRVELFKGFREMHHPEVEVIRDLEENSRYGIDKGLIPLYFGLPSGVNEKFYRKLIYEVASEARTVLKCLLPKEIKEKLKLVEWGEGLYQIHFPQEYDEKLFSERRTPFHLSLIYQELFLFFALLRNRKERVVEKIEKPFPIAKKKVHETIKNLGYELTNAQKRVLKEIENDLKRGKPMQRLLQGDVGSGKTIVALLAALMVIEVGKQVVLMAPTEILATQHYLNFKVLAEKAGIEPFLLISAMKKKEKEHVLNLIKTGEAKLIVGTHAIIQDSVTFSDIGLVIVDEQHRFGVEQRKELINKGIMPHVLYMTATPIPRTLSMTLYGDLDVSIIDELPKGRQPVKTMVLPDYQRDRVFAMIEQEIMNGGQAYVVYPVIDENNLLELKAATKMYEIIKERFGNYNVSLLHGRMTASEKEKVMIDFKDGKVAILVSTTVIEVGVDVPNATLMVIEHGERFGLSSLHQLRGRIGRGSKEALCVVLVNTKHLSDKARERLLYFRDNHDGFKLAEFDLKLRGPGEIFGTKQSGLPAFGFVDLLADVPLIEMMKKVTEDFFSESKNDCYKMLLNDILKLYFSKNADYLNIG